MMMKPGIMMMTCGALTLLLIACDKKAEDAPEADAKPLEDPTAAMAPDMAAAQASPQIEEGSVSMDAFSASIAKASCAWVAQCKNEELVQYLQFSASLMVSFGALGRPDLKDEIEPVVEIFQKLEQEQRPTVTQQECETVMDLSIKLARLDGPSLEKSAAAGHVVYDAEKVKSCLEGFENEAKLCTTVTKVDPTKQMGFPQMQEVEARFKEDLDAITGPCNEVLVGQIEDGAECSESYECKGDSKCKKPAGLGADRRVDGESNKKTCTPAPSDAPQ